MKSPDPTTDLGLLAALGFGPEAQLMSDPKLFVDPRFLGCLIAELEDELGIEGARRAFFEIGLVHGLRDATRVVQGDFLAPAPLDGAAATASTPLVMRFALPPPAAVRDGFEVFGSWPESHEAAARLAKLGPEHEPSCFLSAGYTSGWLSGMLDADVLALEAECSARGDACCRFVARERNAWREADEGARTLELLRSVPYDTFRDLAARDVPAPSPAGSVRLDSEGDFDRDSLAVHVWGPVMVLPYTQSEEALQTIELLAADPETRGVRCVILDLRGAILDEGFDAAAIERLLEIVEGWGAETLLTGVSPLSEDVVGDLAHDHLLIRKDLPEAIASAFQIAEAQRHLI